MPGFPWLEKNVIDHAITADKLKAMRTLGVPYSDADINGAADAVKGKTEMDAMIAYLQVLGTSIKTRR
jgi:cytochrome c oxidase cbb3-type subunit 2